MHFQLPKHFQRIPAIAIWTLFLGALAHCQTQPSVALYGKIDIKAGWKPIVYLVRPTDFNNLAIRYGGIVVDSATVQNDGSFAFRGLQPAQEPQLFLICVQKSVSKYPQLLADDPLPEANYMPLCLQSGQSVGIKAESEHFQSSVQMSPSNPENLLLLQLRDLRQIADRQYRAATGNGLHNEESNLLEEEKARLHFQEPLMQFADSCSRLWPALMAARWVSPSGDYERIPEFLVRLGAKWRSRLPEHPWVKQLSAAGDPSNLPVLQGDQIPNDALPMLGGDTVRLRELLGKKLSILDIWASWCMPCRRENKEVLLPLWKEYGSGGLQIIGYSIDSSPGAWKAAISKDGANWSHASHLTGDATPFLESLRISTIPANFLLNEKGEILAKNLHGEEMKAWVEVYMKAH